MILYNHQLEVLTLFGNPQRGVLPTQIQPQIMVLHNLNATFYIMCEIHTLQTPNY